MARITPLFFLVKTIYEKNPKKMLSLAVLVFLFILVTIFSVGGDKDGTEEPVRIPPVKIASVKSLSEDDSSVLVLGEVRSVSQAELRTQKSGKVMQVYVSAGQFVKAGTILAEIENAGERAAVLSAQGVLASAQAQLDKTLAGARSEDKTSAVVQANAALVAFTTAQDSARSAYSQAYTLAQDAIFAQADDFFSNQNTVNPSFRIRTASYDERLSIENERVAIGELLNTWKLRTAGDVPDDMLDVRLAEAEKDLDRIKIFLNHISVFVSEQEVDDGITSAEKEAQEGTIFTARTSIDGARGAVNAARTGLASARSTSQVAQLTESKTIVGARNEDVTVAEALATQAQGALAGAYATLENSLIRTPISGTVSTLNIVQGDFVSSFDIAAVVANEGAMEIEAFVSDTVRKRIVVGMPARIDGKYDGLVTSVAPGLDPVTKRARITIGVADDATLVNGSFVEIEINSIEGEGEDVKTEELSVPITAIKVLPRTMAVFVVSEEGILVSVPVVEGPIVGSKMIVSEGLTPDMQIVVDVRGLSEGDKVEVVAE